MALARVRLRRDAPADPDSPRWLEALVFLVIFALGLLDFAAAAPRFGSGDSDTAIPLLMANAESLTPSHIYYWGQDRLGGWPFIGAWLVRRVTGFGWTAAQFHWLLTAALVSAIWPIRRLAGPLGWPLAASFLLILTIDPLVTAPTLSQGQPYAWQFAALFWGWWALRRAGERLGEGSLLGQLLSFSLATLVAFLAVWMSPLNLIFLGIVALGETWRGADLRRWWSLLLRAAWLEAPVLIGYALELQVHRVHREYAEAQRIWYQPASSAVDEGFLLENLARHAQTAFSQGWSARALAVIGLCLVILAIVWIARVGESRTATPADGTRSGLAVVTVGAIASALVGFAALVVVIWPRLNGYHPRYLAPVELLLGLGAAGTLLLLLERIPLSGRLRPFVGAALGLAVAVVTAVLAPVAGEPGEQQRQLLRVTQELPRRAPGAVLFGCYWGTYVFIDGTAPRPLVPVVREMDFNRATWLDERMQTARDVVVSHHECSLFGTPEAPLPYIWEKGALLELVKPRWLTEGPYSFSLYRNRTGELVKGVTTAAPGGELAPVEGLGQVGPPAHGQEALRMGLPPRTRGKALLFFSSKDYQAADAPALEITPDPGPGSTSIVELKRRGPFVEIAYEASTTPLQGLRFTWAEDGLEPLRVRGALLLP